MTRRARKYTGEEATIIPAALYLVDNGACYCSRHLGASARATGRDVSGQKIHPLTPAEIRAEAAAGWTIECEACRSLRGGE